MKPLIQFATITPPLLIPLLVVSFALSPRAQAVGPDTDGSIFGSNNGEGIGVLVSRTFGIWNTGTGFEALNALTAGNQNTATGFRALVSDTSGGYNTATGVYSLFSNTTGFFNSATGAYSLAHNTTASNNTANGYTALYRNITGELNTATGGFALFSNTSGNSNTATGYGALYFNTTGDENTATGSAALYQNTIGNFNTAIGRSALGNNTTGEHNTAIGVAALSQNTIGNANIAVGNFAGHDLTTGDHNIVIGNPNAVAGESNTMRIGGSSQTRAFIAGIRGVATGNANAVPVLIDSVGQLGTINSSRRYKKEIKAMEQASEAVLSLNPVTFHYKSDATATPQFGLIAEDVAEINPDLVVRDENGKIYTVRYDAVNAMLLNEFLKEHRKVEAQQATITQLKSTVAQQKKDFQATVAQLTARLDEQGAQIQKVSAQLEVNKPAPQITLNAP